MSLLMRPAALVDYLHCQSTVTAVAVSRQLQIRILLLQQINEGRLQLRGIRNSCQLVWEDRRGSTAAQINKEEYNAGLRFPMRAGSGKRGRDFVQGAGGWAAGRWRCGRVLELGSERTAASRLSVRFFRDRRASLFFRFHLEQARRLRVGQGSAAAGQSREETRGDTQTQTAVSGGSARIGGVRGERSSRAAMNSCKRGAQAARSTHRRCPLSAAPSAVAVCTDTAAAPGIFSKAAIRFDQVCDSR